MNIRYYIQKSLIDFGLSEGESKIYFEVLKNSGIDAGFLKKKTKYSSAAIYKILNSLVDKELLIFLKNGRVGTYFPVPLTKIADKFVLKSRKISRFSEKLKEFLTSTPI